MNDEKSTTLENYKILGYVSIDSLKKKPPKNDAIYAKLRKKNSYRRNGNELINEWSFDEIAELIGNKGYSFQHGKFQQNDNNFSSSQFISGNIVFVDVDDHNYEIEDIMTMSLPFQPSIIYHTLSNGINKNTGSVDPSVKKYRVMWLLDCAIERESYKQITEFLIKRLNGDGACKDAARLLLGGKNLCYADANILNVNDILLSPDFVNFMISKENESSNIKVNKKVYSRLASNKPTINPSVEGLEIGRILERMKTMNVNNKPDFLTDKTSFAWINSLPLNQFLDLPLYEHFCCIMPDHSDNNPSAVIMTNKKNQQVYYCHSCHSASMKYAKSVLGTLEVLSGWDVIKLQSQILCALDVRYVTEHKQRGLTTIQNNKALLNFAMNDDRFEKLKKKGLLTAYSHFLEYVESHLPEIPIISDDVEIFASYGHIAKYIREKFNPTKSFESIKKYIYDKTVNLNSYGFIEKIDYDDLPPKWKLKTVEFQSQHKDYRKITYWKIPKLTIEDLTRSVEMINSEKNCGYRMSDMSIDKITSLYGYEFARKVYNQQSRNPDKTEAKEKEVLKAVETIIHFQSYYTRKMVQDNCNLNSKVVNNFLPGITKKLGYKEVTINKEIRADLKISYSDLNKGSKLFIKIK